MHLLPSFLLRLTKNKVYSFQSYSRDRCFSRLPQDALLCELSNLQIMFYEKEIDLFMCLLNSFSTEGRWSHKQCLYASSVVNHFCLIRIEKVHGVAAVFVIFFFFSEGPVSNSSHTGHVDVLLCSSSSWPHKRLQKLHSYINTNNENALIIVYCQFQSILSKSQTDSEHFLHHMQAKNYVADLKERIYEAGLKSSGLERTHDHEQHWVSQRAREDLLLLGYSSE